MTREEREAAIKYFELLSLDCLGETCESCPHETACKAYTHDETMEFGKLAIKALEQPEIVDMDFNEWFRYGEKKGWVTLNDERRSD